MATTEKPFDQWAIVELMGHVRVAGKVTEVELFGAKMGRIEIPRSVSCPRCASSGLIVPPSEAATGLTDTCPECDGDRSREAWTTQFFGGGSVYRLTPCGEAEARAVAAHCQVQPIHAWEMPRGLPAPTTHDDDDCDDETPY